MMTPGDNGQYGDEELAAALKVLRSLPQSVVAQRVGLSERRLRDIEHGRSTPRPKTRDAILRFAETVGRDDRTQNPSSCSSNFNELSSLTSDGQRTPWWNTESGQPPSGWLVLGALAVVVIIAIVIGSAEND